MSKPVPIKIDFVSDVSCPWCAVALNGLEQAIAKVGDAVAVDVTFQPFELNPQMPPEGQDTVEHIQQKYGTSAEQQASNREAIRARGAAVGFVFNRRHRVYNTFDAHRLLHWAGLEGTDRQRALKHALLRAYFTDGLDVSSHEVLARVAGEVGLDATRAHQVLASGDYATEVRARQRYYADHGITAVPSVIINDQHLIQGGQPPELFEQALRQVAAGH
ncbi:MAG: DsbA family oxidoreductase [Lysobacter sp.]